MSERLKDKIALITGGASGIGFEVAKGFVNEGAKVVIFDANVDASEKAREELGEASAMFVGDVRSYADNSAAVEMAQETFGGLDIFVGNAGVWDWGARLVDFPPEAIDEAFDEVVGINVKGFVLGAKAAALALAKRRGTMIFTLSTASYNSAGGGVIYTAAKHAGLGVVRQLAYELAPRVRVNGVAIGAALTNLRGASALGLQDKSIKELPLKEGAPMFLPMGEQPDPADFAAPYVMLAAESENRTMTGAVIDALCGYDVRGATGPNGWSDYDANDGED